MKDNNPVSSAASSPLPSPWLYSIVWLFMLVPTLQFIHIRPITAAFADGLALLLGACLCAGVFMFTRKHQHAVTPVLLLGGAFLLSVVLSLLFNHYAEPAAARWYVIFLGFALLMALASGELLARLGRDGYVALLTKTLWYAVVVYAIGSLLRYYGLLQWVLPNMLPTTESRLYGLWHQANLNTTTLWLGILAGTFLAAGKPRGKKPHSGAIVVSFVLFGWGIACAASRISWLFAVGLLCLVAVASLPRWRVANTKPLRWWLSVAVLGVVLGCLLVPLVNNPVNRYLTSVGMVDRPTTLDLTERNALKDVKRVTEWEKAFLAIPHMPAKQLLLGVGPGRYLHFSSVNDDLVPISAIKHGYYGNAHNIFVMVFVEEGLLGLLVLLGIIGFITWRVLRRPINNATLFLLGAIGIIFIHSNLEYPLWFAWFLLLLVMLLVPLFGYRDIPLDSPRLKPFVGVMCLIITASLFVGVGLQYKTMVSITHDTTPDRQGYYDLVAIGKTSLMGPYATLMRYRKFGIVHNKLAWQLQEAQNMVAWQPRDFVMIREYFLYLLNGKVNQACHAATQTTRRFPGAATFMVDFAQEKQMTDPANWPLLKNCMEKGLAMRHTTLKEVRAQNALLEEQK